MGTHLPYNGKGEGCQEPGKKVDHSRLINSHIVKNMVNEVIYHHALLAMDDLARKVQERDYECYAYAVDIARAYRNFRSDPLDWPLLGVATHDHPYTDVDMPFGLDYLPCICRESPNT